MTQHSILELLALYKHEKLDRISFEAALQQHIQRCKHFQEQLKHQSIKTEDLDIWHSKIYPGLSTCYQALIGAASEATLYAYNADPKHLDNVVALIKNSEDIGNYLKKEIGLLSEDTKNLISHQLKEVQTDKFSQEITYGGSADSEVSFLDVEK